MQSGGMKNDTETGRLISDRQIQGRESEQSEKGDVMQLGREEERPAGNKEEQW